MDLGGSGLEEEWRANQSDESDLSRCFQYCPQLAVNPIKLGLSAHRRTKTSVFSASSQSRIYYRIPTKWVGTEQPKLVAGWFRKSWSQSSSWSSRSGVDDSLFFFLTVTLMSGSYLSYLYTVVQGWSIILHEGPHWVLDLNETGRSNGVGN